jgi:hypothetical protein
MSITPVQVVEKLFPNSLDLAIVKKVIAPNATYMYLTYDNPAVPRLTMGLLPFLESSA